MHAVLAVNAGSSSLKLSLFGVDGSAAMGSGQGGLRLLAHEDFGGLDSDEKRRLDAFDGIGAWCDRHAKDCKLIAVGHRVVHGGTRFGDPLRVDETVLAALGDLVPLAPLHQPWCLAPIAALAASRPSLVQVACFDTAFHRGRPSAVERYGLADQLFRDGIRRYGFHGLSYESVTGKLEKIAPDVAGGRVILVHLGSGASLCATRGGRCVDTTMGFSVLSGLVMASRCGDLDPGVVLHLLRDGSRSVAEVETMLYRESGLRGISGLGGDMRELLASALPAAREAVDCFVVRVVREIGALTAMLGGLDALVFTAGIGEHSSEIRERIADASAWTGLVLDREANAKAGPCISAPGSAVQAWVIPTDEEATIAGHAWNLVRAGGSPSLPR